MLPKPGVSKLLGMRLQCVVREGVLGPCRSKEARALGVGAGEDPSVLERFGLAHEPDPLACLSQAGVIDLACRFQASEQDALLGRVHPQRDLADKRWRAPGRIVSGLAPDRHGFLALEIAEQSF